MRQQFQVFCDACGDFTAADGVVVDVKTGAFFRIGGGSSGGGGTTGAAAKHLRACVEVKHGIGGVFLGGSGRTLTVAGLPPASSGASSPDGVYVPGRPGKWSSGTFTIEVLGASSATISDSVGVVAELTTGAAPVGDYVATTHGEDTYNSAATFTLAVVAEPGTPAAIPSALVTISAGTAQGGIYAPTDTASYVSAVDPDWTLVVAADGSAELQYLGVAVAGRAAGIDHDPAGIFDALEAAWSYNLFFDDEVGADVGLPWTANVEVIRQAPRAGFVYLTITEDVGEILSVDGPFFATSLPTPATDVYHVPLAVSDGSGAHEQLVTGPIMWKPG